MKKILFMMALMFSVLSLSAQTALQTTKLFDNTSVGVTVGATTPLDFNSVFPLNTNIGIKLQKDFTPVVGLQVEGLAILNANNGGFLPDTWTFVKGTNLGLNGVINWSNWLGGYKGEPRTFEVSTVTGLGWLHSWNSNLNSLTAKTGLDLTFNLGKTKANSLVLTPAVFWNLNANKRQIQFNKNHAQLGLAVTYVHHFKTSNGTRSFKLWDVGAMQNEIALLTTALEKKPKVIEIIKEVPVQVPTTNASTTVDSNVVNPWVVEFAQGSSELTETAKVTLTSIPTNKTVTIVGTASPEGTTARNQTLSEQRATAVKDFLTSRGVTVSTAVGKGVANGVTTNRLAIITAEQ